MTQECARAEILAGAVALGEATDAERDSYRRHLAGCTSCIGAFGGEREIERVMETVATARDDERWEPDLGASIAAARSRRRRSFWTAGFAAAAAAVALSLGIHALVASRVPGAVTLDRQLASTASAFHVTLERRPAASAPRPQIHAAPSSGLVVVHNVVTLTRPAVHAVHAAAAPREKALPAAAPAQPVIVALAPSSHDERTISALKTAATSAPAEGHAESIAVMPTVVRDVAPIGGEDAIVPRPSAIAYDEGAEGTTAFDVTVDEHGNPTKCTITKPSGYLVLDVAVCKAAMRARYTPRSVNGRATASVYHDAFTFRAGEQ